MQFTPGIFFTGVFGNRRIMSGFRVFNGGRINALVSGVEDAMLQIAEVIDATKFLFCSY